MDVTVDGLRDYAEEVERVWGPFTDEDLSEMAAEARRALRRLALRIESGE